MKKVSQLRAVRSQLLSANFSSQLQGKSFCHFTLYPFPVMFFPAAVPGIPHTAERTRVFIRCWGSHVTQMASIIIDNKNNYHHFRQPLRAFVAVVLVFQKSVCPRLWGLQLGIQTQWEKIIINQKVPVLIPDLIDIPRLPVTMMIDLIVMEHFSTCKSLQSEFNWLKGK